MNALAIAFWRFFPLAFAFTHFKSRLFGTCSRGVGAPSSPSAFELSRNCRVCNPIPAHRQYQTMFCFAIDILLQEKAERENKMSTAMHHYHLNPLSPPFFLRRVALEKTYLNSKILRYNVPLKNGQLVAYTSSERLVFEDRRQNVGQNCLQLAAYLGSRSDCGSNSAATRARSAHAI